MALLFTSQIPKTLLEITNSKSISNLSKAYGNFYKNSIANAGVLLSTSPNTSVSSKPFDTYFKNLFEKLSKKMEKDGLNPNFGNEKPSDKEKEDRDFILQTFQTELATKIILDWQIEKFTPSIPIPPIVTPTSGYLVIDAGNHKDFGEKIMKTFYIEWFFPNDYPPIPKQNLLLDSWNKLLLTIHLKKLTEVFTEHLSKISGIYSGNTAVPAPAVMPWVGVF